MQDFSFHGLPPPAEPPPARVAPHAANCWQDVRCDQPEDHQFVAMLDAYRDSGGLAACPELLALCRRHCGADLTTLARWIVERTVVSFEWQSQTWFPLFQFRATGFAPSLRLRPLLMELSDACSPWEAAHWFVLPNTRLGGRIPVALLDTDLGAVRSAAQAMLPPGQTSSHPTASYNGSAHAPMPASRDSADHRWT